MCTVHFASLIPIHFYACVNPSSWWNLMKCTRYIHLMFYQQENLFNMFGFQVPRVGSLIATHTQLNLRNKLPIFLVDESKMLSLHSLLVLPTEKFQFTVWVPATQSCTAHFTSLRPSTTPFASFTPTSVRPVRNLTWASFEMFGYKVLVWSLEPLKPVKKYLTSTLWEYEGGGSKRDFVATFGGQEYRGPY